MQIGKIYKCVFETGTIVIQTLIEIKKHSSRRNILKFKILNSSSTYFFKPHSTGTLLSLHIDNNSVKCYEYEDDEILVEMI